MNSVKMRWRGLLVLAVVVALVGLALAGCGKKSTSNVNAGGTPKPGGTYNFPLEQEPVGIAPVTYQESTGYHIVHEIFQSLVKYELQPDGSMKTLPDIAASWSVSPDLKVWTFKLKHGVMFQPPVSREVHAQDFVADWNFVTNSKNWVSGTPAYVASPIVGADESGSAPKGLTGVKALDDYTLQVTLNYPFAEFYITVGHPIFSAWPLDYAQKMGIKNYNEAPVGTGPYMFKKWVHNQYVDLVKTPNYWAASATDGPFVDTIHMVEMADPSTMWLTFQKGTLDFSDVPVGQAASSIAMAKSKGWTAKKWPQISTYFININLKDPVLGGDQGLPLRQALAYATDREAVINTVREGIPIMPTGMVPVGIPGWNLTKLPYPYDPAKAKAIVAKLGAIPTLNLWYNSGADHATILTPVQAGWKAVGINTKLTGLEWGTYLTKIQQGKQTQIFRLGWAADYPSMDNFLYPLIQSSVSGINEGTFYKNPKVDQLIAQARGTADEKARLDLYAQAENIAMQYVPQIPLYFYRQLEISNPRVANQTYTPMGTIDMWKVWVAK